MIEEQAATQIQEYSKTEAALSVLREKYADAAYEVDTTAGMKEAKAARAEIRGYRTDLEKMRKKIKVPALERCRQIDSEAKRITVELVTLEEPIDAQIKAREAELEAERQAKIEAERKRVEAIQARITEIRGVIGAVNAFGNPAATMIEDIISDFEAVEIDESFGEFIDQARDAKTASMATLRELHKAAIEREDEAAKIAAEREELKRLREEKEKREAQERAEREKKEADDRRKREAEEKKRRKEVEAQQKKQAKEQARIDAESKRLAEAQAEFERKQREEAERRAAKEQAERERKAAAEEAARKAKYPGAQAIVDALVAHFGVTEKVVQSWLLQIQKAA